MLSLSTTEQSVENMLECYIQTAERTNIITDATYGQSTVGIASLRSTIEPTRKRGINETETS